MNRNLAAALIAILFILMFDTSAVAETGAEISKEAVETVKVTFRVIEDTTPPSGGGGSGGSGGGGSNAPGEIVQPPAAGPPSAQFTDIEGHWAQNDIETMYALGLVRGVSETAFVPDRTITRAEFTAMLVRVLGLETKDALSGRFADVTADKWYFDEVNATAVVGLAEGYGSNFMPNISITREQMAVMAVRALKYKGSYTELTETQIVDQLSGFTDREQISAWARDGAAGAVAAGIITGRTGGAFAPVDNATRAEGTVVLLRLYRIVFMT